MTKVFLALVFSFLSGCSSLNNKEETPPSASSPAQAEPELQNSTATDEGPKIDVVALARELGIESPATELGYREKSFGTCDVGYGFSRTHNCRRQVLILIRFRLLCRNSSGTPSELVTYDDMKPIASRTVHWLLGAKKGQSQTDSEGYSELRTIASASARNTRLKIAIPPQFLYMRAGDIARVVAPSEWCN